VLGLAFADAASGKSVMIASVKDSFGKLVSSNLLVYEDAFEGLSADVTYKCLRGSFEQDVILRALPADLSPEAFGMDAASTRVQIWSEFIDPPVPEVQTVVLSQVLDPLARDLMAEPNFTDQVVNFGQVHFGQGKSFATG